MDDANTGLEIGAQSVRHPVRRQGAGVNTNYTVNLTPPHPKEKKPKVASLLDEDIELLKDFPRGLPGLYFFRHPVGLSGARAGERFGSRYLYKYWKKACANLKIEGVDLYGGTRHSTVTALSEHLTPEQIKAGTLHSTNKAFERYFRAQTTTSKLVHETARRMQSLHNFSTTIVRANYLK
jgi:hypothetical protein